MIRSTLILIVLFTGTTLFAQYSLNDLETVERLVMPAVDNAAFQAKEMKRRQNKEVPEIAVPLSVNIHPKNSGTWEVLPTGMLLWRVRIYSKDAYSLNFGFRRFYMPKSGKMYLYSKDGKNVRGPFTAFDNELHGQLWTPIIEGDETVIEIQISPDERAKMDVEIGDVNHGGIHSLLLQNCHLDVMCGIENGFEEVEQYRDEIQSVAMYSINGVRICTGFLVNNVNQDCTPYFMTAKHCEVRTNNAASVVVYWNFENSKCREISTSENGLVGDGTLDDFNSGATLLAEYEDSDMALLRLDDPVALSTNAFFAGWNNAKELPEETVCIHHPDNEEKRISIDFEPAYEGIWDTGERMPNSGHLIVGDWDIGSTEGGSSGAPLFDQNNFVIGQLHGGAAACSNEEYDAFGWFYTSWEGGASDDSRLKNWLDPNELGIERLEGMWNTGCQKAVVPDSYVWNVCNDEIVLIDFVVKGDNPQEMLMLSILGLPESVNAVFSKNPVVAGDSVHLRITNLDEIAGISTIFDVVTVGNGEEFTTLIKLNVFEHENMNNTTSLLSPMDNNSATTNAPTFEWTALIEGTRYDFQLATDPNFENIVAESIGQMQNFYIINELNSNTEYYWRVRSYTPCATTDWTAVSNFNTASCGVTPARDIPLAIAPANPGDHYSSIEIERDGRVLSVQVHNIEGVHSWIRDLQFSLISPAGTQVLLMDRPCFDEDDFNLSFSSSSELINLPCPPTDGRTYKPVESLDAFVGENVRGTWQLYVRDNESQDGGVVYNWSVQFCLADANTDIGLSLSQNEISLCAEESIELDLLHGEGFDDDLAITALNLPENVQLSFTPIDDEDRTSIRLEGLKDLATGPYEITFQVSDNSNNENYTTLILNKQSVPAAAALLTPADASMEIATLPTFSWEAQEGMSYIIEIAQDKDFMNVIEREELNEANYIPQMTLEYNTQYYWRIITTNQCGTATSAIYAFQTMMVSSVASWKGATVNVFPNPSQGQLYVDLTAVQESAFIEVYSLDGKHWHRANYAAGRQHELRLDALPSGVYLLKIIAEKQGVLAKRIVVD